MPSVLVRLTDARVVRPSRDEIVGAHYDRPAEPVSYGELYTTSGPSARYFASRLHVMDDVLRSCPGGDLLDVGCGPGMYVRHLLDERPGDFRITACDRSRAMVDSAAERVADSPGVTLTVARIESMPFPDASFDVVVAMGVLEYADAERGLRELARVVRPGGLVLVTMLNPLSPYRAFEWCVFWPLLRLVGGVQRWLGVPEARRRGAARSGIRAIPRPRLVRRMREAGLVPERVVHYDVTALVPPLDKLLMERAGRRDASPERTVSQRAPRRWLGSAYLVAARRR